MNFPQAINSCRRRYFTFSGRATRSEYWWFFLFFWTICLLLEISHPNSFIGDIVVILLFIPYLTVTVRRLHDTQRSGFWFLLYIIPVVGWLILFIMLLMPTKNPKSSFVDEEW